MRQSSVGPNNSLYARTCDELWTSAMRFCGRGYCFHGSHAARVFGNAACGYSRVYEVQLPGPDSQLIKLIELVESAKLESLPGAHR